MAWRRGARATTTDRPTELVAHKPTALAWAGDAKFALTESQLDGGGDGDGGGGAPAAGGGAGGAAGVMLPGGLPANLLGNLVPPPLGGGGGGGGGGAALPPALPAGLPPGPCCHMFRLRLASARL